MANILSAKKRAKQSEVRRARNVTQRSKVRTFIKRVRAAIQSGDKTKAQEEFKVAVPVIDKMATKGIIHKNAAARYKSRMNAQIKALAAK